MFDTVQPTGAVTPVPGGEIDAAEAALGSRFPAGYREFLTRFGRGVYGGLIRVYTPSTLLAGEMSVTEWRKRIDEYWFWDGGAALLTKQRALECILIADTVGGDEFIFHPSAPDRIYVLAHDVDEIFVAGEGLEAMFAWGFTSGVLDEPFVNNSFEPY